VGNEHNPARVQQRGSQGLLELTAEHEALEGLLREAGGEIALGSELEDRWNRNADALVQKVDSYAFLLQRWEAEAERARAMAKALSAHARALEAARERMLDRAQLAMGPERTELRGGAFRLVRRLNPPSVRVLDEEALRESCPEAFTEVPASWKLDRAKAAAALKASPDGVRGAILTRSERIDIAL
jgi:hypothetical protein